MLYKYEYKINIEEDNDNWGCNMKWLTTLNYWASGEKKNFPCSQNMCLVLRFSQILDVPKTKNETKMSSRTEQKTRKVQEKIIILKHIDLVFHKNVINYLLLWK